jgi:hypothetical protein
VLGAPLTIDADSFKPAGHNLHDILSEICAEIRKTPYNRPAPNGHKTPKAAQ